MIPKFLDSQGVEWTMKITVADYLYLKEAEIIDFSKIFSDEHFIANLIDENRMELLLHVLHQLCKGQYEANGVKDEMEFYYRLDGNCITSATEALIEAAIAFSPAHRQDALRESHKTIKMGLEQTGEKVAREILDHRSQLLKEADEKTQKAFEKHFPSETT